MLLKLCLHLFLNCQACESHLCGVILLWCKRRDLIQIGLFSRKSLVFLNDFNQTCIWSTQFIKNTLRKVSRQSIQRESIRTDVAKLPVVFRTCFAEEPQNAVQESQDIKAQAFRFIRTCYDRCHLTGAPRKVWISLDLY